MSSSSRLRPARPRAWRRRRAPTCGRTARLRSGPVARSHVSGTRRARRRSRERQPRSASPRPLPSLRGHVGRLGCVRAQGDRLLRQGEAAGRRRPSAREAAISYAAYRLLLWRASYGANIGPAFDRLTATLRSLCYRPGFVSTRGDSPAALGNRIAAAAIAFGRSDGSLEREHYIDSTTSPRTSLSSCHNPARRCTIERSGSHSRSTRSSSREGCPSLGRSSRSSAPSGGAFAASHFPPRRRDCPSTRSAAPRRSLFPGVQAGCAERDPLDLATERERQSQYGGMGQRRREAVGTRSRMRSRTPSTAARVRSVSRGT